MVGGGELKFGELGGQRTHRTHRGVVCDFFGKTLG
jgi:hypothetical protein